MSELRVAEAALWRPVTGMVAVAWPPHLLLSAGSHGTRGQSSAHQVVNASFEQKCCPSSRPHFLLQALLFSVLRAPPSA